MRGPIPIRRSRSLPRPVLWLVAAVALFQFGLGHLVHAGAHTLADGCATCPTDSGHDDCPFGATAAAFDASKPVACAAVAAIEPPAPDRPSPVQSAPDLPTQAPNGRAPPFVA